MSTEEKVTPQEEKVSLKPFPDFQISERCDSCGARAYARACVNETDLKFCGHHFQKHYSVLVEISSRIDNGLEQLYEEENAYNNYAESLPESSGKGKFGFGSAKNKS